MKTEILMPSLSPTMEEGSLGKWYVSPGDKVKPGDILADIETDKALMEYESIEEGTIVKLVVKEGTENVKVNSLIAIIETEGSEEIKEEKNIATGKTVPLAISSGEGVSSLEQNFNSVDSNDNEEKHDQDLLENQLMHELTVREAINNAVAEEMRLDEDVFLMGEEVGEYLSLIHI